MKRQDYSSRDNSPRSNSPTDNSPKKVKKPNLTYANLTYPDQKINLTFGGSIWANCPWANSLVTNNETLDTDYNIIFLKYCNSSILLHSSVQNLFYRISCIFHNYQYHIYHQKISYKHCQQVMNYINNNTLVHVNRYFANRFGCSKN